MPSLRRLACLQQSCVGIDTTSPFPIHLVHGDMQGPTIARVFVGAGVYFSILGELTAVARRTLPSTTAPVAEFPHGHSHTIRQPQSSLAPAALPASANFAIGATARCIAATLLNPLSLAKTRMEWASKGKGSPYTGTVSAVLAIARTEGLRGLASGLGPTFVRDAPYSGLYLTVFVAAKQALGVGSEFDDAASAGAAGSALGDRTALQQLVAPLPLSLRTFMAGLVGGAVATLVVHPADTIRTRLQLRSASFLQDKPGSQLVAVKGIAGELQAVWREGGVRVLYAGAAARVVKRTLSTALTWTIFEHGMRLMTASAKGGSRLA